MFFWGLVLFKDNPVSFCVETIKELIELTSFNTFISGTWEQIGKDGIIEYIATIDDDSITIYANDEKKSNLYWAGDFNSRDLLYNKKITFFSKNFSSITNDIEKASHIEKKEFKYGNNTISFAADFDDEYRDIVLKRNNVYSLPIIKIPNSKTRHSGFDNVMTQEVLDYVIEYPAYFDVFEEDSKMNTIRNSGQDNSVIKNKLLNNDFIVRHPGNNNSYAELFFCSYKNANIKTFDDLRQVAFDSENCFSETSYLLSSKEYLINGMDAITNIFVTFYDWPVGEKSDRPIIVNSLVYETWVQIKGTDYVIELGMGYDMCDTSDYDYITDYKKMLNSLKKK